MKEEGSVQLRAEKEQFALRGTNLPLRLEGASFHDG